jgi:hypothetical protein
MDKLLEMVGLLLSAYGAYGAWSGSVWAKSGLQMKRVDRCDEPVAFWLIAVMYICMGQLMFWSLRYHFSHMR